MEEGTARTKLLP